MRKKKRTSEAEKGSNARMTERTRMRGRQGKVEERKKWMGLR